MTVRSTLISGDQKDQIDKEFKQSVVKPILKFHFKRDEFLGRINEFVYFLPFSDSELRQLVEFQLKMWKRISLEKHSIQLDWTEGWVTIFFLAHERHIKWGALLQWPNSWGSIGTTTIRNMHPTLRKSRLYSRFS